MPKFVDAQKMAARYRSFHAPSDDLISLRPGDFVKVCSGGERFWVVLTKIMPGHMLQGKVNNDITHPGLRRGDVIQFSTANVFDVLRK